MGFYDRKQKAIAYIDKVIKNGIDRKLLELQVFRQFQFGIRSIETYLSQLQEVGLIEINAEGFITEVRN